MDYKLLSEICNLEGMQYKSWYVCTYQRLERKILDMFVRSVRGTKEKLPFSKKGTLLQIKSLVKLNNCLDFINQEYPWEKNKALAGNVLQKVSLHSYQILTKYILLPEALQRKIIEYVQ